MQFWIHEAEGTLWELSPRSLAKRWRSFGYRGRHAPGPGLLEDIGTGIIAGAAIVVLGIGALLAAGVL